jgi:predicted HNH restriction endonuclease
VQFNSGLVFDRPTCRSGRTIGMFKMNRHQWLKLLGEETITEIGRELGPEADNFIRASNRVRVVHTDTKGYCTTIARLTDRRWFVELWLDEFTHGLRVYYGVCTAERSLIKTLADGTAVWRRPKATFYKKDTEYNGQTIRLNKALPQRQMNQPVAEFYDSGRSWYGSYSSLLVEPLIRNGRMPRQLTQDAVSFFVKVARTAAGILGEGDKHLTAVERRMITHHEKRERWARNHGLADRCKRRDGYTCRICGFSPVAMYKQIKASGAIEAHHKLPFSGRSPRRNLVKTELKDLIAVCRNCHAALHASGVGGNVRTIRKAFTGQWPKRRPT